MYRDFSEVSKENLLRLVAEVEEENWCSVTDWFGDRWLDFQEMIGKLDINKYLNDLDNYHKIVIDKNNATKKTIENIFNDVARVDLLYKSSLDNITSLLSKWQSYLDIMTQIVLPQNGQFNVNYITNSLYSILQQIDLMKIENNKKDILERLGELESNIDRLLENPRDISTENKHKLSVLLEELRQLYQFSTQSKQHMSIEEYEYDAVPTLISLISKASKLSSKYIDNSNSSNDLKFFGAVTGYLKTLYTYARTESISIADEITGGLNLLSGAGTLFNEFYSYVSNGLNALNQSRLGKVWQPITQEINVLSNGFDVINDGVELYGVLQDENVQANQKSDAVSKLLEGFLDFGEASAESVLDTKVLSRSVTAKYQYQTSYSNANTLNKIKAGLAVGKASIASIGESISKYYELSEDGNYNMGDIAETGIFAGVKGLTQVVKGFDDLFLKGIGDMIFNYTDKSDEISSALVDSIDSGAAKFVQSHRVSSSYTEFAQPLKDIANDQNNNLFYRIAASAVAGAGMTGAVLIDTASDVCSYFTTEGLLSRLIVKAE